MRNEHLFPDDNRLFDRSLPASFDLPRVPRQGLIGLILVVALLAFEIFNFDTTRYALSDLLGEANFAGVRWAVILAVAFCAIDFAGLAYLFSPAGNRDESREVWYLMGAWLLGATMNAMMTWWAVNLTLLEHSLGNEVLTRQQLLEVVPPFVAVLVWLIRILFIGAISVAGDHFFRGDEPPPAVESRPGLAERSRPMAAPDGAQASPRRQPRGRTPQSPAPWTEAPRRSAPARMSARPRRRS